MRARAVYAARNAALIGILSALLTATKYVLSGLPNIEPVTLLLIVYTVTLGWKRGLAAALVFSTVEILIYGFNTWVLMYYVNWPLLVLFAWGVSCVLRPLEKRLARKPVTGPKWLRWLRQHSFSMVAYALLGGAFGFAFGFLCALVQAAFYTGKMGYWAYATTYWLNGVPFDTVHAIANFLLVLTLSAPLMGAFSALKGRMRLFQEG